MVAIEPRLSPPHSDRGYPFLVERPLQERNVYSIAMASFSVCAFLGTVRPMEYSSQSRYYCRGNPASDVTGWSYPPDKRCEPSAMCHAFSTGSQQEQEAQDGKLGDLNVEALRSG